MDYLQYGTYNPHKAFLMRVCFKPYYKWITFNTLFLERSNLYHEQVLNLIINGLPSILKNLSSSRFFLSCFKPYYKWITFNTLGQT